MNSSDFFHIAIGIISALIIGVWASIILDKVRFNNKRKKQYEEAEKGKCQGAHSWIDMMVQKEQCHVCKVCGYVPSKEGFVSKAAVQAELSAIKFREELEEYKTSRMSEIAEENGLDIEKLEKIVKEVYEIKKKFVILFIEKQIKEMKEKEEVKDV